MRQLEGFLVDTDKLHAIIYDRAVPRELSDLIWTRLEDSAIRPGGTESFHLGMDLMEILKANPHWKPYLIDIMENCRDMNKLPLVMVRGQKVDGSRLSFQGGSILGPGGVRGLTEGNINGEEKDEKEGGQGA
jgi:hypothetical protein